MQLAVPDVVRERHSFNLSLMLVTRRCWACFSFAFVSKISQSRNNAINGYQLQK